MHTDLQAVLADYQLDLHATLAQHWRPLLATGAGPDGPAPAGTTTPATAAKLRAQLQSLLPAAASTDDHAKRPKGGTRDGAGSVQVPALAAQLSAVVGALCLAAQEWQAQRQALEAAQQRLQLQDASVDEVRGGAAHQRRTRVLPKGRATNAAACVCVVRCLMRRTPPPTAAQAGGGA
jgi:hypothetical protein